jgi:hypothetical protein
MRCPLPRVLVGRAKNLGTVTPRMSFSISGKMVWLTKFASTLIRTILTFCSLMMGRRGLLAVSQLDDLR